MDTVGRAKRVRVYLSEDDRIGRRPAPLALLELLRGENVQGATVLRASAGFGAAGEIHTATLVDVAPRLPVVVEWVDRPEVVDRLLPRVVALVGRGLVTVDETEVAFWQPHPVRDVPAALTAADVMSRDVASVARDAPLADVVRAMLGKSYRAVPVVEGGAPVGILTNGDLVRKGGLGVRLDLLATLDRPELHEVLERLAATGKLAGDVMTPAPVTVRASARLPEVADAMARRHLKRLPVVGEDGKLAGMVSRRDLLRAAAGGFAESASAPREIGLSGDAPLSRVMRRDVPLVHPETPLPEVFQAVVATRLNRALVVDADHRVAGLVTDAELLDRITPSLRAGALRSLMRRLPFAHPPGDAEAARHARARTAADLMTRDVAIAREDALVADGIAKVLDGNHKVLAVVDAAGTLVGIVDRADLLHALLPG